MIFKKTLKKVSRPNWILNNYRDTRKLWLDKNENTDEILAKQTKKMLSKLDTSSVFSYPNLGPIYKKLGNYLKINPKKIILTSGSDAGIKMIFEAFVSPKDIVIRTNPTFAMYGVYTKIYDTREIVVNYKRTKDGPKIDIKKFLRLIKKKKPRLICLPNSDSPTGHAFKNSEIKDILSVAKTSKSLVLIDEAYYPFYGQTSKRFLSKYENLLITRTTAKAWGLAGLRVGFVLSSHKNINEIHKIRPMYEINNIGAQILSRILSKQKYINQSVKRLINGKKYFRSELKKIGFKVFKSEHGNFLHVDFLNDKKKIIKKLNKIVYFRHNENHPSISGYSRFSLTSKKNFSKIIKQIRKTINK